MLQAFVLRGLVRHSSVFKDSWYSQCSRSKLITRDSGAFLQLQNSSSHRYFYSLHKTMTSKPNSSSLVPFPLREDYIKICKTVILTSLPTHFYELLSSLKTALYNKHQLQLAADATQHLHSLHFLTDLEFDIFEEHI